MRRQPCNLAFDRHTHTLCARIPQSSSAKITTPYGSNAESSRRIQKGGQLVDSRPDVDIDSE